MNAPAPRADAAAPILDIAGLAFGYRRAALFESFDARLSRPGVVGLFGRNGSGKSTLLKLMAGLLTPKGGRLRVLGHEPRRRRADFLAQVYLLPEEFHLPDLTPHALAASQGGFYPRFSPVLFDDYLAELQVPTAQRFGQMSLGQKKKATIAFALATQTPLLLMDEPTNGLDIVARGQFKRLMARPEQAARSVLISTHQAHDLESLLHHIWFIDQGRLLLSAGMAALARRLDMGVAATEEALPPPERLLYREAVGSHWAWVARRQPPPSPDEAVAPIQLELVYKALSLNPQALLHACAAPATEPAP